MGRYKALNLLADQVTVVLDRTTGEIFDVIGAKQKLVDDFLGGAVNADLWTEVEVGDSTKAVAASILTYHLHVTGEAEDVGIYGKDDKAFNLDKGIIFSCRFAMHVTPTVGAELIMGIINDSYGADSMRVSEADEIAIHALFVMDGSNVVVLHTDDSATDNDGVATGITLVNDAYHIFTIIAETAASVKFYIDGVRVAPTTTFNMSTGANVMFQPVIMAVKNGADAGLCDFYVDHIKMYQLTR